jgi:hypothetical protein
MAVNPLFRADMENNLNKMEINGLNTADTMLR